MKLSCLKFCWQLQLLSWYVWRLTTLFKKNTFGFLCFNMSLDQLRQVRTEQRLCYLSMSLLVLVVLLNPFNPASRLLQCEIDLVSSQADSNPCWRKSLYITWPNLPSLDSSKTCHLVNIPTQTKWSIKALASLSTHFSPASSQYVIKYCVVATIRRSETRVFVYKYK